MVQSLVLPRVIRLKNFHVHASVTPTHPAQAVLRFVRFRAGKHFADCRVCTHLTTCLFNNDVHALKNRIAALAHSRQIKALRVNGRLWYVTCSVTPLHLGLISHRSVAE